MFQERHLNFSKFLQQRAEQISKFRDILKLQTKKKGHQSLPKCVRRRAMSHNRYRIPSRLRKINEEELIKSENMQRIPKCRKHIRKSRRLILSYKDRHSKIKWLSTHLWAAKRMRMIDYHGYKVAQTPNQKAFRSSYRHFRHNCCMIDFGYYQCMEIKIQASKQQHIIDKFIKIVDGKDKTKNNESISLEQLRYDKMYDGFLYNQEQRLVCPLLIFKCSSKITENEKIYTLRCFFNPCALEEVSNLTKEHFPSDALVRRCNSQMYCLMGPEWNKKLTEALKIYGFELSQDNLDKLKIESGLVNYFTLNCSKREDQHPYISKPIDALMRDSFSSIESSNDIRSKTLKLFQQLKRNSQPSSTNNNYLSDESQRFWQFFQQIPSPSELVNISITTRSKYTHKRKNKLTKESKKKVIELETKKRELLSSSKNAIVEEEQSSMSYEMISESLESIKNEIRQFFVDDSKKRNQDRIEEQGKNGKNEKVLRVNPVLISSFRKQQLLEGCYIFCSDEDSCRLWRILSKLNIKVIGLQELNHITLQSQALAFPQNYPQTQSFLNYAQNQAQKQFRKIKRAPPQKRINYLKINSPNPFSLVEPFLGKPQPPILTVFIEMVSRGRCFDGSYIYELTEQDIQNVEKQLSDKGKVGIILSETTKNQCTAGSKSENDKKWIDYSKETLESAKLQLSQGTQPQRNLIGRLMTGGYLYSKSKEGGIAYVANSVGKSLQKLKNDGYILIRKVSSPHYYLGQITKIYQSVTQ